MGVVFEFQQVVKGVFKEERTMLNTRAGESQARLLIKRQALYLDPISQRLPFLF
jgi:hypothetical protein